MQIKLKIAIWVLALFLATLFQVLAPVACPAQEGVFRDVIGVEVINIDVFVTDRHGKRVDGLDRDAFELSIDGKKVPITNFFATSLPPVAVPESPEAEEVTQPPAVEPAKPDPYHLVVYMDDFYLGPVGRRRVLEDLPEFFDRQLATGARIMLLSHGTSVKIIVPFTDDRELLLAGLQKAGELPPMGIQQRTDRATAYRNIQSIYEACQGSRRSPCTSCLDEMKVQIRAYSTMVENQKRGAVASLDAVIDALGSIQGRKALVHVSEGVQLESGAELNSYLLDLCPQFAPPPRVENMSILNRMTANANAGRITLYAVEAGGPRVFSSASAEYGSRQFTPSISTDSVANDNLQNTLHFVSDETGGKAILNTTKVVPALISATADLNSYYSLGFQPDHPAEGSAHRVKVEVKAKGTRVRFRRSFLHKTVAESLADKALGAFHFGLGDNDLGVEIKIGSQQPGSDGRIAVPILIRLPLAKLVLIPGEKAREGSVRIVLAALDPKGKEPAVRERAFSVSLPLEGEQEFHQIGIGMQLEPGDHLIGIGIWDDIGATGSFMRLQIHADP